MAFLPENISKFFKQFFTKGTFLPDEWGDKNKEESKTGKTELDLPSLAEGYTTKVGDKGRKELKGNDLNALGTQVSELSEKVKELTEYIEGNRYRNNLIPYTCFLGLPVLVDESIAYRPVYKELDRRFNYNDFINPNVINLTKNVGIPYLTINGDYKSYVDPSISPAKVTKIDNNPLYTHFGNKPSNAKFLCKHNFTYNDIIVDNDGVGYNYGLEFARVIHQFWGKRISITGVTFVEKKMSQLTDIRKTLDNSGYDPNRYYNDNDTVAFMKLGSVIPNNISELALFINSSPHYALSENNQIKYNIGLPRHDHTFDVPARNLRYKYSGVTGAPDDNFLESWRFSSVPPYNTKNDADFILALNPVAKRGLAGGLIQYQVSADIGVGPYNNGRTSDSGSSAVFTGNLDVRGNRIYLHLYMVI